MKKILLGLFLLIPSALHADSITSGSLGLLIPSTGTIDTTRRWDDKIYRNFEMIASTINTTIGSIGTIATDTTTLLGIIKSTSVALSNHINNYNAFTSTTQSDLNVIRSSMVVIRQSTSTLQSNFYAFTSTTQADLEVIRSSMVAIRQSTSTLGGVVAQRTQVWGEEGGALSGGDVTRVDCLGTSLTCTQSGSTVTVTVAGSGGGGGPRPFQVVVGTLGSIASEVDIASSTTDGLIEAMRRLNAMGLTYSTTGYGTILFRPGTYIIDQATIPAGITIYAIPGSSVVWKVADNGRSIATVYGKIQNINFDYENRAYRGWGITITGEGQATGFRSYGSTQIVADAAIFMVYKATNAYVKGEMYDLVGKNAVDSTRNIVAFTVLYSSDSVIELNTYNAIVDAGFAFLIVEASRNVIFRNCYFHEMAQAAIAVESSNDLIKFENSIFVATGNCESNGCLQFGAADSNGSISTQAVVVNNIFIHANTGTAAFIGISQTVNATHGTVINGNRAYKTVNGAAPTFIKIGPGSSGTIIMNNTVANGFTFISDGGANTQYTSLQNFVGHTQQ